MHYFNYTEPYGSEKVALFIVLLFTPFLPAAMEFWLVCLGILAYSCQNTLRDNGV